MNKTTQLSILLIVCAALLLGYVFLKEDRPAVSVSDEQGILVKDFIPDKVTAITLKKGDVAVELKKKDKDWIMPLKNRAAKTDRVDTLLTAVKEAAIAKTRPGKLKDFDLTPETRTELTLEREAGKISLLLGKSPEYGKSFVQRDAGAGILEIDKNLTQNAGVQTEKSANVLDPAYFYDLKIFADSADDCIDIAIKKGNEITRLQKIIPGKGPVLPKQEIAKDEKPVWWLTEPEGAEADESKANSIASTALNLTAKGYADDVPEKDRGLDKPSARIVLRLKDGTERAIVFGKVESDDAIISAVGKPDAYKVYKYVYETCTKTDELKKKEEKKEGEEKKDEKKDEKTTLVIPPVPPKLAEPPKPAPSVPAPAEKKEK